MENENLLGIYLSKTKAAAVLLSAVQANPTILNCFSVSTDQGDDAGQTDDNAPSLAGLISQALAVRALKFGEVSIAIDCSLFTQHNLRSEFTDPKQIAQTIKFDAEEVLATDAANIAVAFEITAIEETGSDVTVYTADRHQFDDILADLQTNNLDPIAIEPDITCIARFIGHNFSAPENVRPFYTILSSSSCYMIGPKISDNAPTARSFLLGPSQDKTTILSREVPITIAASVPQSPDQAVSALLLSGNLENIDYEQLAERTGLEIQTLDLPASVHADHATLNDCASTTAFTIAYGAAMSDFKKMRRTDFREDFAPYQGRRLIVQKTLRILSISITIMMLAIGVYFQSKVIRKHSYIASLDAKSNVDYSVIMSGKKHKGPEKMTSKLKRELKNVKSRQAGGNIDDESAPAKLTYIFKAFNSLDKKIDLNIESIKISAKTMNIKGDTNSRSSTLKLYNSLKKQPKLKLGPQRTATKAGRDTFNVTLELE